MKSKINGLPYERCSCCNRGWRFRFYKIAGGGLCLSCMQRWLTIKLNDMLTDQSPPTSSQATK